MNPLHTFFDLPESNGLTGGDRNLYEINKYVRPALNQIGFECSSISGRKDNVQRIFKLITSNTANFLSQIFYVQSVRDVPSKSRISIPAKIVNSTSMENRIEETLFYLGMKHIWLFVSVRTYWYVLIKYSAIPSEGWNLSFRHKPGDRMNVKSEYLAKMVKPYTKLEEDIENILNNKNDNK
jgi:hypothetical protein